MTYPQHISTLRDRHERLAEQIQAARDEFFTRHRNLQEIQQRLRAGKLKSLRDLAREIRDKGIYSRKTSLGAVEMLLLKRLRHAVAPEQEWHEFIRRTVGLGYLNRFDLAAAA